jgi:sulfhydrogenase subunit gamma (sulfur reductase)
MDNVFLPFPAEIMSVKNLNRNTKLYRIRFVDGAVQQNFSFKPGQFVEISVAGIGEAPISISSTPVVKDYFELCIKKVGRVTEKLHEMGKGDTVGIRGPYGNGFSVEQLYGHDVVFIAGGIGIAPLRSLIDSVMAERRKVGSFKILFGAKTPGELIFMYELERWRDTAEVRVTVDRGDESWSGHTGFVSEITAKTELTPDSYAVICGPPAMFGPTIKQLKKKGIEEMKIAVSAERKMKCGVGKCGHCIAGGETYICLEGPVFSYEEYQRIAGFL